MRYTLRNYQTEAVDAALEFFRGKPKYHALEVLPTGSGKSLIIANIAKELNEPTLIFQPRKEILEQNLSKFLSYGHHATVYSASVGQKRLSPITFATIGSVVKKANILKDYKHIIVDECHFVNAKKGMYQDLFQQLGKVKILGLTATPYRLVTDGYGGSILKFLTRTRPRVFKDLIYYAQNKELFTRGYLSKLKYQVIKDFDKSQLRLNTTGADYTDRSVIRYYERINFKDRIANVINELKRSRRGILVFTRFVEEAQYLTDKIPGAAIVTAKTHKKERERVLQGFKSGRIPVVCNCGVLTVGFDYPELDTIVMARPTLSLALYYQMCLDSKTEILTTDGWKNCDSISDSDFVAGFDMKNESISFVPIEEWIDRPLHPGEHFWGIKNPMIDIRVTNRHSMVVKKKKFKKGLFSKWYKRNAEDLSGEFRIPCAGFTNNNGVPLSDDELRFIGWVLTDGNINKITQHITISQGEHQPWNDNIERCLKGCGFKYSKTIRDRNTQFNQTSKCVSYYISKGKPRGKDKHLRGWERLEGYLDKDISLELLTMNQRQFSIFLETIHFGDGNKQLGQNWTRRSYHISSARRQFIDNLQILCVLNGYASHSTLHNYNKNPIWIIHIKPSHVRSIMVKSSDKRPVWGKLNAQLSERVWCVRNRLGTIVTRRNGKVSIVGNCGRGIRPHPLKDYALVVDMCDNIRMFGAIEGLKLNDGGNGKWFISNNGRQLTNVYYGEKRYRR